jgi:hypothetical protein
MSFIFHFFYCFTIVNFLLLLFIFEEGRGA